MSFLFGGARQTGQDSLRDYQRRVTSSARGMEREVARLDLQERGLQRELAKLAAEGRIDAATIKAQEMVRLRAHRSRVQSMKGHMTGLAQQLQTVQSTTKIQETIAMTARMLQRLNTRFDAGSVAAMLREFERQNSLMASKQEVVEDTLDCAFEVDGEQEATSEAVLGVLQEVGLDVQSRLHGPAGRAGESPLLQDAGDNSFEARLQRLRPRDG